MSRTEILAAMATFEIGISSEFVPWSKSRNAKEKNRTMNWTITLTVGKRSVLTTDYEAGIAHCPSYRSGDNSMDHDSAIRAETETGFRAVRRTPILPDPCDVIFSLVMDSDAIDAGSFEDWASNLGYDIDSRAAERAYQACLGIGLKLRAALGEQGLATLRTACEGY